VPLPEAWIDLHQLVAAVPRVPLELHLREAEVLELVQEVKRRLDDLFHPDGLADTAGADSGRGLPQLAAAEDAERRTGPRDVAADGVERVVAARDELLHHRRELLRAHVRVFRLLHRVAAEGLPAEALLEADRMLRLDEDREADLLRRGAGIVRRPRVARAGRVDAEGRGLLELGALALDSFEHVPGGERRQHRQVVEVLREDVERVVVRREHDDLAECADERDEACLLGAWIRREETLGVLGAEAEGARPVVESEHTDPGTPE